MQSKKTLEAQLNSALNKTNANPLSTHISAQNSPHSLPTGKDLTAEFISQINKAKKSKESIEQRKATLDRIIAKFSDDVPSHSSQTMRDMTLAELLKENPGLQLPLPSGKEIKDIRDDHTLFQAEMSVNERTWGEFSFHDNSLIWTPLVYAIFHSNQHHNLARALIHTSNRPNGCRINQTAFDVEHTRIVSGSFEPAFSFTPMTALEACLNNLKDCDDINSDLARSLILKGFCLFKSPKGKQPTPILDRLCFGSRAIPNLEAMLNSSPDIVEIPSFLKKTHRVIFEFIFLQGKSTPISLFSINSHTSQFQKNVMRLGELCYLENIKAEEKMHKDKKENESTAGLKTNPSSSCSSSSSSSSSPSSSSASSPISPPATVAIPAKAITFSAGGMVASASTLAAANGSTAASSSSSNSSASSSSSSSSNSSPSSSPSSSSSSNPSPCSSLSQESVMKLKTK